MARPIGTVTFLFTNVEGKTRPWGIGLSPIGRRFAAKRRYSAQPLPPTGGYTYKMVGGDF